MALNEHVQYEPHARLRYSCSPHHVDSAFYPIIGELERAAGFAHEDDLRTTLEKLAAELERRATPSSDRELFANMLSLGGDGHYPELSLGTCAPSGYLSRALTPEASLDLGSNFIELRFWEIRRPRLGWVCLTDAKQARRPRRGFFCDFRSPLRS